MDTSVSQTSGVVRWFCRVILVCLLVLVEWCRRLRSCIAFAVAFVKGDTGQCKQTGKKPASLKCVSLVISQPHLDALDIAKTAQIASWCLKMGIRYVFAFDPEGVLKANSHKVEAALRQEAPDHSCHLTSGWTEPTSNGTTPPGNESAQVVHLLCKQDALYPILSVASSHSQNKENSISNIASGYGGLDDVDQYWSSSLSMEDLKKEIAASFSAAAILEPDVVLVAGPVFSLSQSPPWHSRFSEIYYLGPLPNLRFDTFCKTLGRFWKTNQRFGA